MSGARGSSVSGAARMHNTRPPGPGITVPGRSWTVARSKDSRRACSRTATGAPERAGRRPCPRSRPRIYPPPPRSEVEDGSPLRSVARRRDQETESSQERQQTLRPARDPGPAARRRSTRDDGTALDPVHGWPPFRRCVRARGGPSSRSGLNDCGGFARAAGRVEGGARCSAIDGAGGAEKGGRRRGARGGDKKPRAARFRAALLERRVAAPPGLL